MPEDAVAELIECNRRLLAAIGAADWATYRQLCDESLTAFEPESLGHLVEGLAFHKFYFDLGAASTPPQSTITSPHVRMLGADAAVVSYVRLVQKMSADGKPITVGAEETRVWQRKGGTWRHVHFHRSPLTSG